jgi:nucleoid-associated protein YgaU
VSAAGRRIKLAPGTSRRAGSVTASVAAAWRAHDNAAMRVLGVIGGWWLVLGLGACSEGRAAATAESRLVLEVGGQHASLRRTLIAGGVEVAPPQRLRTEAESPDADAAGGEAAAPPPESPRAAAPDPTSAKGEPVPPTPPPAPPASEESFFHVKLANGQTLIHLARKHLGDGNRFREILALNGWTEAQSRRLAEGQRVKIPREPRRSSPPR